MDLCILYMRLWEPKRNVKKIRERIDSILVKGEVVGEKVSGKVQKTLRGAHWRAL